MLTFKQFIKTASTYDPNLIPDSAGEFSDYVRNYNPEKGMMNAALATGLGASSKFVPAYLSRLIGGRELANKWNDTYDSKILSKLPLLDWGESKKLPKKNISSALQKAKGKLRFATFLAGLGGAGALSGFLKDNNTPYQNADLAAINNNISPNNPSISSPNLANLLATLGYTGGGAVLGTLLGQAANNNSDSKLLPILGGILGGLGGYAFKNRDNISNYLS